MVNYNYHTHTFRCGHANLKEEDAIKKALELKLKNFGFSDHLYISGFYSHLQIGSPILGQEYKEKVLELKKKYQDKINIYFGYECEYYPETEEKLRKLLADPDVDYLILGNHYQDSTLLQYYGGNFNDIDFSIYFNYIKGAVDSGLFSYIAHPDLFMAGYKKWDKKSEELSYQICNYCKINQMPLEINYCGLRKGKKLIDGALEYPYPSIHFWRIAKKVGNIIVVGIDAHTLSDFNHKNNLDANKMIKELGLVVEKDFNIIKKQKNA